MEFTFVHQELLSKKQSNQEGLAHLAQKLSIKKEHLKEGDSNASLLSQGIYRPCTIRNYQISGYQSPKTLIYL